MLIIIILKISQLAAHMLVLNSGPFLLMCKINPPLRSLMFLRLKKNFIEVKDESLQEKQ